MLHPHSGRPAAGKRSGQTLFLFVLLLPVLLGMIGLVIDTGLMMAARRQAQNAADAAATAAALYLLENNNNTAGAKTMATKYVQNSAYNNLGSATVTPNIPPSSGPYQGNPAAVEVIVSLPVQTWFIQMLGVSSSQTVKARAVAAYEPSSAGEGVGVLNPNASPGLVSQDTNTVLQVNGRVIVNSTSSTSVTSQTGGGIRANYLRTVGQIASTDRANIWDYNTLKTLTAVYQSQPPQPDPLINLPTPTTANGVQNIYPNYDNKGNRLANATSPQAITVTGSTTITFVPGIYQSITVKGGTVTFQSGIYVLAGGGLSIQTNNSTTITGSGVMFYNTGANYNATTGAPDNTDSANFNPIASPTVAPTSSNTGNTSFGSISVSMSNGATVNLTPSTSSTDPFRGMLFYQRRANYQAANVTGSAGGSLTLGGTIYAEWAQFTIAGGGSYNAQFIVGSLTAKGGGTLTINYSGQNLGRANEVFLVQ
jgi:Flp pilus assembly protein TadG